MFTYSSGHKDWVTCVAVMHDGSIVSGSRDDTLKIWDKDGKCLQTLRGHTGLVRCVAVMQEGTIVSGSDDNTLKIWDFGSLSVDFAGWQEINLIELDNLSLRLQVEKQAVSKSLKNYAKFLDKDNLINEEQIEFKTEESLKIFLLTVLGGELKNNKVKLNINLPNLQHLTIRNNLIESLSGSFTALETLKLYNKNITLEDVIQLEFSKLQYLHITVEESELQAIKKQLAFIRSKLPIIREIIIEKQYILSNILEGHTGWVTCVADMPDGTIVSGSRDETLKIWDKEGKCLNTLKGHGGEVHCVAVMPDGNIVSGSGDKTLKIWDKDGKCLHTLMGHTNMVKCVAIMQNGNIVSGSSDNNLRIWNKDGRYLYPLVGHKSWVTCVAVMQDGTIVSGSRDETLKIWDKEGKHLLHTLNGHTKCVNCVAAMQNDTIVSGSWDNTLKIWDKEGKCLLDLEEHTDSVTCAAVMQNGSIVSGSYDKTLKIWDKDGNFLRTLMGHTGWVKCVAVMQDGTIVSGSEDETLSIWESKLSLDFAGWQDINLIELYNLNLRLQVENKVVRKSLADYAKFLDEDNLIHQEQIQFKTEESLKSFLLTVLGGEINSFDKIKLNINLPNLQHLVIKNCTVIKEISGCFTELKEYDVDGNIIVTNTTSLLALEERQDNKLANKEVTFTKLEQLPIVSPLIWLRDQHSIQQSQFQSLSDSQSNTSSEEFEGDGKDKDKSNISYKFQ